jgi:Tol biopolymer transport system component
VGQEIPKDRKARHEVDIVVRVIDSDGSNSRQIVRAGSCACVLGNQGVTWSPDGMKLALVSTGPRGRGLYTVNLDGTGLRRIARDVYGRPAWRSMP